MSTVRLWVMSLNDVTRSISAHQCMKPVVSSRVYELPPNFSWWHNWLNQQIDMCAQQRLRSAWASTQSDQSSLFAWRNIGPLTTYWLHSEYSDQTGRMPRLIGVFAGSTCHFAGFVVRQLKYSEIEPGQRENGERNHELQGKDYWQNVFKNFSLINFIQIFLGKQI